MSRSKFFSALLIGSMVSVMADAQGVISAGVPPAAGVNACTQFTTVGGTVIPKCLTEVVTIPVTVTAADGGSNVPQSPGTLSSSVYSTVSDSVYSVVSSEAIDQPLVSQTSTSLPSEAANTQQTPTAAFISSNVVPQYTSIAATIPPTSVKCAACDVLNSALASYSTASATVPAETLSTSILSTSTLPKVPVVASTSVPTGDLSVPYSDVPSGTLPDSQDDKPTETDVDSWDDEEDTDSSDDEEGTGAFDDEAASTTSPIAVVTMIPPHSTITSVKLLTADPSGSIIEQSMQVLTSTQIVDPPSATELSDDDSEPELMRRSLASEAARMPTAGSSSDAPDDPPFTNSSTATSSTSAHGIAVSSHSPFPINWWSALGPLVVKTKTVTNTVFVNATTATKSDAPVGTSGSAFPPAAEITSSFLAGVITQIADGQIQGPAPTSMFPHGVPQGVPQGLPPGVPRPSIHSIPKPRIHGNGTVTKAHGPQMPRPSVPGMPNHSIHGNGTMTKAHGPGFPRPSKHSIPHHSTHGNTTITKARGPKATMRGNGTASFISVTQTKHWRFQD